MLYTNSKHIFYQFEANCPNSLMMRIRLRGRIILDLIMQSALPGIGSVANPVYGGACVRSRMTSGLGGKHPRSMVVVGSGVVVVNTVAYKSKGYSLL